MRILEIVKGILPDEMIKEFEEFVKSRPDIDARDFYYLDEVMELCHAMGFTENNDDFTTTLKICSDAKAILPSTRELLISFDKEKIDKWFLRQGEIRIFQKKQENEFNNFKFELEQQKNKLEKKKWEKELASAVKKECSVYYILNAEQTMVKIGISENVKSRIKSMQTGTGYELELLHTILFPSRKEAMNAESFLHNIFSDNRKQMCKTNKSSEWFDAKICDSLLKNYSTKYQIESQMGKHKWKGDYYG